MKLTDMHHPPCPTLEEAIARARAVPLVDQIREGHALWLAEQDRPRPPQQRLYSPAMLAELRRLGIAP